MLAEVVDITGRGTVAMADDREQDENRDRDEHLHRRHKDPIGEYRSTVRGESSDGQFVQTVRRFDAGLSIAWRWGIIIVVLIGFGITIQTVISKSDDPARKVDAMIKSFDDFKTEIRGRLDHISNDTQSVTNEVHDLKNRVDQQDKWIADARTFLRDQNDYNFNVNHVTTEMATTMKLRGLPAPTIPNPPKFGGQ